MRPQIDLVHPSIIYDFVYVDEESFEKYKPKSFRQLVDGFREYKRKDNQAYSWPLPLGQE